MRSAPFVIAGQSGGIEAFDPTGGIAIATSGGYVPQGGGGGGVPYRRTLARFDHQGKQLWLVKPHVEYTGRGWHRCRRKRGLVEYTGGFPPVAISKFDGATGQQMRCLQTRTKWSSTISTTRAP